MAAPLYGITRVIHCDWSVDEKKRWAAVAEWGDGRWVLDGPSKVSEQVDLLTDVGATAETPGATLVAFDFPIGVPSAWGRQTGVASFAELLPELGEGRWSDFYDVAVAREEISITRPFYPFRPGGTSRTYLWEALGMDPVNGLRACERPLPGVHSGASPLFWTLGGKQVGKAALAGWAALQPHVAAGGCVLWPFAGDLGELVQPGQVIVTESYPGAYYTHVGGPMAGRGWKKTGQADRAGLFESPLLTGLSTEGVPSPSADRHLRAGAEFTPWLQASIRDRFCNKPVGEDKFDAAAGLLGALEAGAPWAPQDDPTKTWEGWILGVPVPATPSGAQ